MHENKVLYQIKTLEKMIARYFLNDGEIDVNKEPCPTPTQMQIIDYIIEHHDTDVYQRDLEEVLNLRRATVSGVLQTMEKNGLVERVIHSGDARTKKIILNEKAKNHFMMGQKRMQELEKIVTKDVSNEDLKVFSNVLNKMKENIEENCKLDKERSKL